jgi:hypothetical protein
VKDAVGKRGPEKGSDLVLKWVQGTKINGSCPPFPISVPN